MYFVFEQLKKKNFFNRILKLKLTLKIIIFKSRCPFSFVCALHIKNWIE